MILRVTTLILTLCLFLAGCSKVKIETRIYPEAGVYGPMPYESVLILRSPPATRFLRLGEIHIQPLGDPSPKEILKKFRKAAGKIGADGVVLVADPAKLTGIPVAAPGWWNRELPPPSGSTIVGVAIWFPTIAY